MEGLLIRAEKDPNEKNKLQLQDELQTHIDNDETFALQLKSLVEELKTQDPKIRQVILSGIELTSDLKAQNITQKTSGSSGSVDQAMLTNIKANNIIIGDLTQEG
jgi:ribosome-binding factor A